MKCPKCQKEGLELKFSFDKPSPDDVGKQKTIMYLEYSLKRINSFLFELLWKLSRIPEDERFDTFGYLSVISSSTCPHCNEKLSISEIWDSYSNEVLRQAKDFLQDSHPEMKIVSIDKVK